MVPLSGAALAEVRGDLYRNIVAIHSPQDLYNDLSDAPADWAAAQQAERDVKPAPYASAAPIIHRPFEDAQWQTVIGWPFAHPQGSRFSSGRFGVWYGCTQLKTTVYETVHHWVHGLLADAGFAREGVRIERRVHRVACQATLVDLRPLLAAHPELVHPSDYTAAQALGARLHGEGQPGLVTDSVRLPGTDCHAVLNPAVLGNPRVHCPLTYRLEAGAVVVEREPGRAWLRLAR